MASFFPILREPLVARKLKFWINTYFKQKVKKNCSFLISELFPYLRGPS